MYVNLVNVTYSIHLLCLELELMLCCSLLICHYINEVMSYTENQLTDFDTASEVVNLFL